MKNCVKYAFVGIAGYFIGFYEMKYKVMKCMTEGCVKQREEMDQKKSEE